MKYLSNILFLAILMSCEAPVVVEAPKVFLSQEQLIDVIVDVQVLESHYHNVHQRPNVYANALDSATFFIFEEHAITKSIFQENLEFYALEPDSLFSIYESALDTVNNRINSSILR